MPTLSPRTLAAVAITLLATDLILRPPFAGHTPSHVSAAQAQAQSGRDPQFENDDVRVWRSIILPDAPLTLHRHDHARIIIALQGGAMNLKDSSGTDDIHVWEKNHAYWLPAMPPGAMHMDVNAGKTPLEVMVVELKRDGSTAAVR